MKKNIKITSVCITLLMLILNSISIANAKTIYELYGYSYTILNNTSISLCGWDNSSQNLVIPDSIQGRYFTEIDSRALEGNEEITSVDFSQATRLNFIGFYAFEGCTGLSHELIIPESVSTIREGAFMNCSAIPKVTINANVTEIQRETFRGCTSLETAFIPESVSEIGILAFGECTALKRVDIPRNVTKIAESAFRDDTNLVLGVYKDTYALQYAEDNKIDHIILDGDKIGDVNGDGVVDILDATEIQKYAAESREFTPEQFELGDINDDGYCDVIDALLVQKSVIGAYEIPQKIIRY